MGKEKNSELFRNNTVVQFLQITDSGLLHLLSGTVKWYFFITSYCVSATFYNQILSHKNLRPDLYLICSYTVLGPLIFCFRI